MIGALMLFILEAKNVYRVFLVFHLLALVNVLLKLLKIEKRLYLAGF